MAIVRNILRLLKWSLIIGFIVFLIHCWLLTKSYVFSEREIANIAKKYSGEKSANIEQTYKKIYDELQKKHTGHLLPYEETQWLFMNAGGWMGSMRILHASLTEYVLFFGTAVDTVGHSGRYWANVSDTLLAGEFRQWEEGKLAVNTFKPGDTVVHVWGEVTAVNFKAGTWMVEYGRGFIPSTLGFALSDTIFSTQDFITMFHIFKVYGKALLQEAGFYIVHMKELFTS